MKLLHTSPEEITNISLAGRFGEFLFFSHDEYVTTAGDYLTYAIELDDSSIIAAGELLDHENAELLNDLLGEVKEITRCNDEQAASLLTQESSLFDFPELCLSDIDELDWDIQRLTGEAGRTLGFRAVEALDEQGACYIVPMFGRENCLELQH